MDAKSGSLETGIEGLDKILNGGIPERSQTLIAGGPGTGKTLMAFQILYNCAKRGIPSAFIALDELPSNVIKNVKSTFGNVGDIDELIRKRMLIVDGDESASKIATNTGEETSYSMGNLMSEIEGIIKSVDARVVAVDSLSFLKLMLGKTMLYNKSVSALTSNLRRSDVTGILTLDIPYYQKKRMKFGQELLLYDGVMALYHDGTANNESRVMQVIKIRGNRHDSVPMHYGITPNGLSFK